MLTSIRGLSAATLSAGLLISAAPAFASEGSSEITAADETISAELLAASAALDNQTAASGGVVLTSNPAEAQRASEPVDSEVTSEFAAESGLTFSANVAFTTEYRFRGVDLSGGEFAIQGGFDVSHSSGLYAGTWASTLDEDTVGFGSTEIDVYAGWSGNLTDGLSTDVGAIYYLFPDSPASAGDTSYIEFYGSLSTSFGPASFTSGIAYAPSQSGLGNTDNLYLYSDVGIAIPDSPFTINGHLGYTDGFLTFTTDSEAYDWSIGVDMAAGPVTITAAYVGVEGDGILDPGGTFTDDAFVLTLAASF